jgi:hypothetical protein
MPAPLLDVCNYPPCLGLVPVAIKFFGGASELHNQIAGQVLRIDFAAFFPPQTLEGGLIIAHDDSGVRAAYKRLPVGGLGDSRKMLRHNRTRSNCDT